MIAILVWAAGGVLLSIVTSQPYKAFSTRRLIIPSLLLSSLVYCTFRADAYPIPDFVAMITSFMATEIIIELRKEDCVQQNTNR